MKPDRKWIIRRKGRGTEALLRLLKQLTAHARWIFVALLLLYLFSSIHTIRPNQQALVIRWGRLQPKLHGPGLLVGLPAPFDRVLIFETGRESTRNLDQWARTGSKVPGPDRAPAASLDSAIEALGIPAPTESGISSESMAPITGSLDPTLQGYTLTHDLNLIQGRFTLRYRIVDPFHFTLCGDQAEAILDRLAYHSLTGQLAKRTINASLTSDRQVIAVEAAMEVQHDADSLQLGVHISGIDILELSPPSQVLPTFEDVVNAKQEAKTLLETAHQYQAETLARTRGDAASLALKEESEAAMLISQAQGETAGFLAMLSQYQLSPDLVSRRLLRETLDIVMGRVQSRTLLPTYGVKPSLLVEPLPSDSP